MSWAARILFWIAFVRCSCGARRFDVVGLELRPVVSPKISLCFACSSVQQEFVCAIRQLNIDVVLSLLETHGVSQVQAYSECAETPRSETGSIMLPYCMGQDPHRSPEQVGTLSERDSQFTDFTQCFMWASMVGPWAWADPRFQRMTTLGQVQYTQDLECLGPRVLSGLAFDRLRPYTQGFEA